MLPYLQNPSVMTKLLLKGSSKFILILVLGLSQNFTAHAQQITLKGEALSLPQVFSIIEEQTGYSVLFSQAYVLNAKPVNIDVTSMPLKDFLKLILKDEPLKFIIEGTTIFIQRKAITLQAADREKHFVPLVVTGKVIDMQSKPMQGLSVTVKGSGNGVATDDQGEFAINITDPKSILEFSYVGFKPSQERVNGRNRIMVKMEPVNKMLEDAVVYNGYQKIERKYLTGSVTSLRMDSIIQPGFTSVDKMLEGRVPGLIYMLNSGQVGAAPQLRIRGTSTLLGSREPLWVVDGIIRTDPFPIPASSTNDPDFVNLLGNAVSGLNPFDIERIDILKDATAAALYGVRAANGVIVITTKRGKSGPPTINYSVTGTYTRRPRYTDNGIYVMNSKERVDVSREMIGREMTLRGGVLEAYEKSIVDYYAGRIDYNTYKQQVDKAETTNTDWFKEIARDVIGTQHSLSLSGGSPAATYRASLGYTNEPGVMKNEYNNRYTGLLNVLISGKKFKGQFNIDLTRVERRYNPSEITTLDYAYGISRAIPLRNDDGSLYYYSTVGSGIFDNNSKDIRTFNILNEMDRTGQSIKTNRYVASANLDYEIANGIQLNTTLSYEGINADERTWFGEKTEWVKKVRYGAWDESTGIFNPISDPLPLGGELRQNTSTQNNFMIRSQIDFRRFIDPSKKHFLGGFIGGQINSRSTNSGKQVERGYYPDRGQSFARIDINAYPTYGQWLQGQSGSEIVENLDNSARVFLNANYIYDDRFVLATTVASDYSNSFGNRSNERFLPTWSLSGRWNLHNDLLKNSPWIDMAAIRLSYGTIGNVLNALTPNTIIRKGSMNDYYGNFGATIYQFPNPKLGWELTRDYTAGLDFSFFRGRIAGSIGYFLKRTSNAFLTKRVSIINGISAYTVNAGILENRGLEIDLKFIAFDSRTRNGKGGFVWSIDPQFGQVINQLIGRNLKSRNVLVDPGSVTFESFLDGSVPINGKSVNTFYSYQFKGLDPKEGFPIFYLAEPENALKLAQHYNNMSKEELFQTVMVESGKREPVLQGAIANSFSYKNWSLRFSISYSVGNKIRLLKIASGNYGTFKPSSQQNLRKEFVKRWRLPGDELTTNIPGIQGNNWVSVNNPGRAGWWLDPDYPLTYNFASDYYQMYDFSDLRVVSGDYIKLQQANLLYSLSPDQCRSWRIKGASVMLSGTNLFVIANKQLRGQDPAQSGSSPNINLSVRPNYSFTINLSL